MDEPSQSKDKKEEIPTAVSKDSSLFKVDPPQKEMELITLIGQREKLCRDDLTAMMLAGEESLRMLIHEPSQNLIDFVKQNLFDEDALLSAILRFEMPKADFEA